MKIATWNVNSIRQREAHVRQWIGRTSPDILFLQEIKCEASNFPLSGFQAAGYHVEVVGQKAYNGVAVLARAPFQVVHRALPGLPPDDVQARYIEVLVDGMTLIGLYLPNGNSRGDDGFAYKMTWMDRLTDRARALLDADVPFVMTGDFNVCPSDNDFAPGALSSTDALVRPESRQRWRRLLWMGLTDAIRAVHPHEPVYTFWDYQAGAWQRDIGLRIDHALLSPTLAERLASADPDADERGVPQPSDHVPVTVRLA